MYLGGVQVLELLAEGGTQCIAMRCAGFDRVDMGAAEKLGIKVLWSMPLGHAWVLPPGQSLVVRGRVACLRAQLECRKGSHDI